MNFIVKQSDVTMWCQKCLAAKVYGEPPLGMMRAAYETQGFVKLALTVSENRQVVKAAAMIYETSTYSYISCYVLPKFRGNGLSLPLTYRLATWAHKNRPDIGSLQAFSNNPIGIALWTNLRDKLRAGPSVICYNQIDRYFPKTTQRGRMVSNA